MSYFGRIAELSDKIWVVAFKWMTKGTEICRSMLDIFVWIMKLFMKDLQMVALLNIM